MEDIQHHIKLVKDDMRKRFPNCPHTIRILLWDDNTSLVECRYGTGDKLHLSTYYQDVLTYNELDISLTNGMMVDENGLEYFSCNTYQIKQQNQ